MPLYPELERLVEVMSTLRLQCPWDRQQTHRSLVPYLVEETCEVVEAVEGLPGESVAAAGPAAAHLREELGDLLLQVVFHAQLASEVDDGFDLEDVAGGISDKLVARHPHVFAAEEVPSDLHGVWEQRKAKEKGRTSALDGIPESLSALSRASKVIGRSRSHRVPLDLPTQEIDAATLGRQIVALVARAQAGGVDAEQAVREAVRELEAEVRSAETPAT
ncbi:MAG TPA: MazG family protein [Microlunatus sp.]|jgi:XTP/dITP diphosphohydrolase|nr:MazG family protein [Microlunatus sp.]